MTGLTHRYPNDDNEHGFSLGPIDFQIDPGELVFISGGNGSGKTTFAHILAGLYAPDAGNLSLGTRVVSDDWLDEYRQHISTVFAEPFVFESLLGYVGKDVDEKARFYIDLLQLSHCVSCDNGKFSTINLSKGQRKRLALLVAYIEDRPIYLFDEWAADQDPAFKEVFYRVLLPELKARNKAVIVITHDDKYFEVADRRIHFENGQIAFVDRPAAERQHVLARRHT